MHHQAHLMLFELVRSRGEQIARDSGRPEALVRRDLMLERRRWRRRRQASV